MPIPLPACVPVAEGTEGLAVQKGEAAITLVLHGLQQHVIACGLAGHAVANQAMPVS